MHAASAPPPLLLPEDELLPLPPEDELVLPDEPPLLLELVLPDELLELLEAPLLLAFEPLDEDDEEDIAGSPVPSSSPQPAAVSASESAAAAPTTKYVPLRAILTLLFIREPLAEPPCERKVSRRWRPFFDLVPGRLPATLESAA